MARVATRHCHLLSFPLVSSGSCELLVTRRRIRGSTQLLIIEFRASVGAELQET